MSGKSFAILFIRLLTSERSKWLSPSLLEIISLTNSSFGVVSNIFLILIYPSKGVFFGKPEYSSDWSDKEF
jgi:hypothetical protein